MKRVGLHGGGFVGSGAVELRQRGPCSLRAGPLGGGGADVRFYSSWKLSGTTLSPPETAGRRASTADIAIAHRVSYNPVPPGRG